MPDPFAMVIPDAEIEDRLLIFLKMNGADRNSTMRILRERAVLVFFLSCNKYQASPAHVFAPLEEYSEPVRKRMRRLSPFDSWIVALPRSEARRLLLKYDGLDANLGGRRLDVIVLGRGFLDGRLAPDPDAFREVYSNRAFRVYERRLP